MSLATKVKNFLLRKLTDKQLTRRDFSKRSQVPYTTISRIMKAEADKGREFNPEIDTILKIANYFKCTMDEVIDRKIFSEETSNE